MRNEGEENEKKRHMLPETHEGRAERLEDSVSCYTLLLHRMVKRMRSDMSNEESKENRARREGKQRRKG